MANSRMAAETSRLLPPESLPAADERRWTKCTASSGSELWDSRWCRGQHPKGFKQRLPFMLAQAIGFTLVTYGIRQFFIDGILSMLIISIAVGATDILVTFQMLLKSNVTDSLAENFVFRVLYFSPRGLMYWLAIAVLASAYPIFENSPVLACLLILHVLPSVVISSLFWSDS